MKKITIIFATLLLILTGCTNGSNEEKKEDVIEDVLTLNPLDPVKEDPITLTSGDGEKFDLYRIDSSNTSDAKEILEFAKKAIEKANVPANIVGMYSVPCGLATSTISFDPIMIKTDNKSVDSDPLFMVLLLSDESKNLLGIFRESELNNKDYRGRAIDIYNIANDEIRNKLGFDDDNIVNFDLMKLIGLDIYTASNEFKKLYEDCCNHYTKARFAMWDGDYDNTVTIDNMEYALLKDPNINSISDLTKYLEEVFISEIAQDIMNNVDSYTYAEVNNHVYFLQLGMGGNYLIQDIKPIAMAQSNSKAYLIIECTEASDMDENWNPIGVYKSEYMYEFVKQNNTYKCCKFVDIPFGLYGY